MNKDNNVIREHWKIISSYSDYEISDLGSVRERRTHKKVKAIDRFGFNAVRLLGNDNKYHYKRVNLLVAEAFIPNPSNYNKTRFIDGNRYNCRYTNIQWIPTNYNCNYEKNKTTPNRRKLSDHGMAKKIVIMDLEHEDKRVFNSIKEASLAFPDINYNTMRTALSAKRLIYKRYSIKYVKD